MSAPHPERLLGKVVVVTGAGRGQGAAEAEALTREGARVIATDATEAPGCRRLDVTREQDWAELATELRESYGQVHGLVNNAGITWRARLGDVHPEDMARVHAVNVVGPLLGIQHLAPLMPPGSSVVNVGSSVALTAHYPVACTTSKWALRGLSKTAALELGPRGIRVNTIHPGYIETEMTASAAPAFRETPLGRASPGLRRRSRATSRQISSRRPTVTPPSRGARRAASHPRPGVCPRTMLRRAGRRPGPRWRRRARRG